MTAGSTGGISGGPPKPVTVDCDHLAVAEIEWTPADTCSSCGWDLVFSLGDGYTCPICDSPEGVWIVDQPTARPTRKMTAVGLAGAVTTLVVILLKNVWGIDYGPEFASSLTMVLTFVAGYFVRERFYT